MDLVYQISDPTNVTPVPDLVTLQEGYESVTVTDEEYVAYTRGELIWNADTTSLVDAPNKAALVAEREANEARSAALIAAIATARQWAEDARSTDVTTANAVAVLEVVVERLGVFFDFFADLLEDRFEV